VKLLGVVSASKNLVPVASGTESPCLDDGKICFPSQSCHQCCNKATYWNSKMFSACGTEPCLKDGTVCLTDLSCRKCCSKKPGHAEGHKWYSKGGLTACGVEPCWPSKQVCLPYFGGSCDRCCKGNTFQQMIANLPMVLQGMMKNVTEITKNMPTAGEIMKNMPTAEEIMKNIPTVQDVIKEDVKIVQDVVKNMPSIEQIMKSIQSMAITCI